MKRRGVCEERQDQGEETGPGVGTPTSRKRKGDEAKLLAAAGWGFKRKEPAEQTPTKEQQKWVLEGSRKGCLERTRTGEGIPKGRAGAAGAVWNSWRGLGQRNLRRQGAPCEE